jgi:hypothetical protein
MGGSSTKIEYNKFTCNNKVKVRDKPLSFKKLTHIKCIFMSQDSYNSRNHIPRETLVLEFNSTIATLDNDIEQKIFETYQKLNEITSSSIDIKVLNPIYIAFSRKLEYSSSVFDDPNLKQIVIDKPNGNTTFAISSYIASYFATSPNPILEKKYKNLPSNSYEFRNGTIIVLMYFPFLTNQYKYITNFTDIINSSTFLVTTIMNTEFNGLPDVNTFDEAKIRKNLIEKQGKTQEEVNYFINKLKIGDKKNFRYSDDLIYLCNEGGCISDVGEDFTILLPTLSTTDSDNDNSAIDKSPFLPTKCISQTLRYQCGVINADKENRSLFDVMKSPELIDYLTQNLKNYIINEECIRSKSNDKKFKEFCKKNSSENPNYQQTPIDIINNTLSYQLRNQFSSDFNEKENNKAKQLNHYSKDYSINIIKELMFLRSRYPGIQEIVFPLYKYTGDNKNTIDPPWGQLFLTRGHIIDYNESIEINIKKYSLNNEYFLMMNDSGQIYVKKHDTDEIYYYLNINVISNPLYMKFTTNISITFRDPDTNNVYPKTVSDPEIKIIMKDEIHKEPFNLYLNNEGKLRVYSNGFLDATDQSFINYIDNKIGEYIVNKNDPNYNNKTGVFNRFNKLDTQKLATYNQDDKPLYLFK